MLARFLEIFAQVANDLVRTTQEGQDVDEAKELQLDGLIAHGPFHEPIVPPTRRQRHRPMRIEAGKQLAAICLRESFDVVHNRHRRCKKIERSRARSKWPRCKKPLTSCAAPPGAHAEKLYGKEYERIRRSAASEGG